MSPVAEGALMGIACAAAFAAGVMGMGLAGSWRAAARRRAARVRALDEALPLEGAGGLERGVIRLAMRLGHPGRGAPPRAPARTLRRGRKGSSSTDLVKRAGLEGRVDEDGLRAARLRLAGMGAAAGAVVGAVISLEMGLLLAAVAAAAGLLLCFSLGAFAFSAEVRAHASAEVSHPAEQGLMGIMEVFLDTILMCTLTALVILVSGVPVPYGRDVGVELTTKAFAAVYGDFAPVFIAVSLVCFAFATVLGWGLYGARCAQFLFGARAWKFFVAAQMAAVVAGACLQTGVVWSAAEAVNGLMVIPNLTALAILTPEVVRLTKEYQKSGGSTAGGGSYADIHQRKPV